MFTPPVFNPGVYLLLYYSNHIFNIYHICSTCTCAIHCTCAIYCTCTVVHVFIRKNKILFTAQPHVTPSHCVSLNDDRGAYQRLDYCSLFLKQKSPLPATISTEPL